MYNHIFYNLLINRQNHKKMSKLKNKMNKIEQKKKIK